ncbi:MAG: hypothetical protein EAX86_06610 [Candidatus Heimdallarchaeota archaeon]|nr:hypothetical protein [Candidatus Heimdallarchaeota archaeon]
MKADSSSANEIASIKKAIMNFYHEGHVVADPDLYEKILHPEWKFFMFDENNNLKIVDKTEYYSWYDPNTVDSSLKWITEFHYVDIFKNNAQVKLTIKNQRFGYLDYFNLMKIDKRWWIVHKLSQPLE